MTEQRAFLIAALRRVDGGGDISNEELAAGTADARRVEGDDLKAYYALSYWTDGRKTQTTGLCVDGRWPTCCKP